MTLAAITVPQTPACTAALDVASTYCSPALLNHSIRAYLWAAAHAQATGIAFDAELLYVASLLHDIGLVDAFDNQRLPFEIAGGHVAWVFGAGVGWPAQRRTRAAEIIERHMWDQVDPTSDPEGHLLEFSTGLDISGRSVDAVPATVRAEVLARYPRLDLGPEFLACFRDQAERKPGSRAAHLMANGIAERIAANPLDR
ncbi:MAG TPA: HD domain-containing protein [Micromonosporaceae bacterium]